jgi:PIN domain nuclease of toxin-antitoxin system
MQLANLPSLSLRRDPFDRVIICQALQNSLIIATVDIAVRAYPVSKLRVD